MLRRNLIIWVTVAGGAAAVEGVEGIGAGVGELASQVKRMVGTEGVDADAHVEDDFLGADGQGFEDLQVYVRAQLFDLRQALEPFL